LLSRNVYRFLEALYEQIYPVCVEVVRQKRMGGCYWETRDKVINGTANGWKRYLVRVTCGSKYMGFGQIIKRK
jgi:hypothetical protein